VVLEISKDKNIKNEYNFKDWTVKELREFASQNNITIPSKSKKNEIIKLLNEVVSHPEFIDRTKEDELDEVLEEELIAGEEEDPALLQKERLDLKFWQKPPFSSLLDFELAKDSDIAFYDLASLVDKFFSNMLHEELINYKISGIALKNSAYLHHYKISSIIKEEEEIQKKEELEKFRQRYGRSIPKTLPQPIQPKLLVSTKEELFEAMRSAIIETMQNKEKLRRRRLRREELKEQRIQMKSEAKLPKELLKHISGREQSIEELHESWYNRIKAKTEFDNKETSFFDISNIIKNEEENDIGKKFAFVRMFLALMFLSNNNRLTLSQDEDFKDFVITLKK
jgi:chromatin segregation and condensation protein Rec8/ScpA/Scc1 (kleisin family)